MGKNPSKFKGDDLPVENISWNDAVRFCNELSIMLDLEPAYNIAGTTVEWIQESCGFRLPTEAEWEYACRAGTTTRFSSGDLESDLEATGWYRKNSKRYTHSVRQKEPNAWGIFDMHGNVWEWVVDDWHDRYKGAPDDGSAWIDKPRGAGRVIRGGGWYGSARGCRSAIRHCRSPGFRNGNLGFRLSRSVALGT